MAVSPIGGQAASIRRAFNRLLWHRCTITPITAGADNGYDPSRVEGTPRTGVPCRYEAQDRLRLTDGSRVTVSVPTIQLALDDPILPEDLVSDIRDSAGVLVLAGPLAVETVEP